MLNEYLGCRKPAARGPDVPHEKNMPESTKDHEQRWPFWLLKACLPLGEDVENEQPMSNRQFYVGLLVALAIVIAAGMLIRGCSI